MAMAGGGETREPRGLEFEFIEIVPFRSRGHRGRAFARREANDLSLRCRPQMGRQHDVGMCGGNGCIKNRAQQRASVGHGVTASFENLKAGTGTPLSLPLHQKKTPEDGLRGFVWARAAGI